MRLTILTLSLALLTAVMGCEPLADTNDTAPGGAVNDATPSGTGASTDGVMTDPVTGTTPEPGAFDTNDQLPAAGVADNPPAVDSSDSTEPVAPDNTAKNERDVEADTKTPFDQSSGSKDTQVTAEIRQQILDMDDASVNARNAKIITVDGKVTLRGPVEDEQERTAIEQIATKVAGEGNVENLLEVKTE